MRNGRAFLFALTIFILSAATELYPADENSLEPSRYSISRIVPQIQRADYEGDRPALKRLHDELTPIPEDNKLAARVLYWRGFALWRRAINGFNESPTPTDLEGDLTQAVADFKDSIVRDPAFAEPKIGAGSSLGYLMFLHRKDPTLMKELLEQSSPLLKEAMAIAPDNPRLLWVLDPIRWSSSPERGGGQDKAFEIYNKGFEALRNQKRGVIDPLEPSWGPLNTNLRLLGHSWTTRYCVASLSSRRTRRRKCRSGPIAIRRSKQVVYRPRFMDRGSSNRALFTILPSLPDSSSTRLF